MKRTIIVCDVTGNENNVLSVDLVTWERHCQMDAAGDTDEEWALEKKTIDLSHLGATILIAEIARLDGRGAIPHKSIIDTALENIQKHRENPWKNKE